jgi:CYTH domain-containing protein
MANSIELERTFLLRNIPGLKGCGRIEVEDLYIPKVVNHPTVRIRKIGSRMEITKKTPAKGSDSSEQNENTIPLSSEEYGVLSKLPGNELLKTRYFFRVGDTVAEIDIFHGKLEGLAMVDFEFSSRQAMEAFQPPAFCLAEVTQEHALAGGMLCGKSYRDIEPTLARYGYRKVSFKAP